MTLSCFFRVSWLAQLLVGIGLFTVSFLIENQVMQAFLSAPLMALGLTVTLEIGKAVAIVWHRYMVMIPNGEYPLITRLASGIFRMGLVLLSLVCSMMYLASHLDRPNLNFVRMGEMEQIEQQMQSEIARIDQQSEQSIIQLNRRQEKEYFDTQREYDGRMSKLEVDRRAEMDNVINGTFKGARYNEFERQITITKQDRIAALGIISSRHAEERQRLQRELTLHQEQARLNTTQTAEKKKAAILVKDYAMDERVNDPHIMALLKTFESVSDLRIEPLQFVFVFSILVSVLMEVGIFLAFDTVTVVMMPAIQAQHRAEMETEVLKSQLAGEVEREDIMHDSEMERVTKRADRTIEEAEVMVDKYRKTA